MKYAAVPEAGPLVEVEELVLIEEDKTGNSLVVLRNRVGC